MSSNNGHSPALVQREQPVSRLKPISILDLTDEQYRRIDTLAQQVKESGLAYKKLQAWDNNGKQLEMGVNDIRAIILKGLELGMLPMAALESLDWILGRPTLDPAGMIALCMASGQLVDIKYIEETDAVCTIEMTRWGMTPYRKTATIEQYAKMSTKERGKDIKLTEKSNWRQQPATMLKCRLISAMCRYYLGDVIQGLYTAEELGAEVTVDDSMRMVVVDPVVSPPPQSSSPKDRPLPSEDSPASEPEMAVPALEPVESGAVETAAEETDKGIQRPSTSIVEELPENQEAETKLGQITQPDAGKEAEAKLPTPGKLPPPTPRRIATEEKESPEAVLLEKRKGEFLQECVEMGLKHEDGTPDIDRINKIQLAIGGKVGYTLKLHDVKLEGIRNFLAQKDMLPDGTIVERVGNEELPFVEESEAEDDFSSFEFTEA